MHRHPLCMMFFVQVLFCHDYQNSKCSRTSCKFLHCPREVENEYHASGYLPPYVREQMIQLGMSADGPANVGRVPVCKDNLGGKCARAARCKFRHITPREYDIEMGSGSWGYGNFSGGVVGSVKHSPLVAQPPPPQPTQVVVSAPPPTTIVVPQQPPPPISTTLTAECAMATNHLGQNLIFTNCAAPQLPLPPPPTVISASNGLAANPMKRRLVETVTVATGLDVSGQEALMYMQQENHHLRLQLQDMERKVADLTAANEFLLEQNANLRISGAAAAPPPHIPRPW